MSLMSFLTGAQPGQPANPWMPPSAEGLPGAAPGRPEYHGLSGFVDRFLHPTNPIGMLGKYISQAAGGIGGGIYNAADADIQNQQQQQMQRVKYALDLAKINQPDYQTVGNQIVAVPKFGGAPQAVFTGQQQPGEIARGIADLKANGATPEQIQSFIASKADPVTSVPGVDEQGNSILRFIPRSQMAPGGLAPPPSGALPPLPPGFKLDGTGGPTPSASGTFR